MPRFTRRHARALAAGAATTAAYLAGAKATDSRTIRGGSLLLLALTATVGAAQASAVAKTTKKRLDTHIAATAAAVNFVANGGTVGGNITCNALNASSVATGGGSINTSGGNLTVGAITTSGQISMGGSLIMNNNDAFTFGHITANQIGPGGTRASLGSFTVTSIAQAQTAINALQARSDFHNGQLNNANIDY
jgi:hypothetical protein